MVKTGQYVTYVDPTAKERPALVTAVWGQEIPCSINVVFINSDEAQTDSYGRKIERSTSVPHRLQQTAHGNYWRE